MAVDFGHTKYEVWGQTKSEHLSFGVARGLDEDQAAKLVGQLMGSDKEGQYWYEVQND